MKRFIIYLILVAILCTCLVSCAQEDKTVFGVYTDSATSSLTIGSDNTYSGNINGVSVSGKWKYNLSKITVLEGEDSYSGISLTLIPNEDDVKLDAVVYSVSSGQVKLQLNGVVYTKQ